MLIVVVVVVVVVGWTNKLIFSGVGTVVIAIVGAEVIELPLIIHGKIIIIQLLKL